MVDAIDATVRKYSQDSDDGERLAETRQTNVDPKAANNRSSVHQVKQNSTSASSLSSPRIEKLLANDISRGHGLRKTSKAEKGNCLLSSAYRSSSESRAPASRAGYYNRDSNSWCNSPSDENSSDNDDDPGLDDSFDNDLPAVHSDVSSTDVLPSKASMLDSAATQSNQLSRRTSPRRMPMSPMQKGFSDLTRLHESNRSQSFVNFNNKVKAKSCIVLSSSSSIPGPSTEILPRRVSPRRPVPDDNLFSSSRLRSTFKKSALPHHSRKAMQGLRPLGKAPRGRPRLNSTRQSLTGEAKSFEGNLEEIEVKLGPRHLQSFNHRKDKTEVNTKDVHSPSRHRHLKQHGVSATAASPSPLKKCLDGQTIRLTRSAFTLHSDTAADLSKLGKSALKNPGVGTRAEPALKAADPDKTTRSVGCQMETAVEQFSDKPSKRLTVDIGVQVMFDEPIAQLSVSSQPFALARPTADVSAQTLASELSVLSQFVCTCPCQCGNRSAAIAVSDSFKLPVADASVNCQTFGSASCPSATNFTTQHLEASPTMEPVSINASLSFDSRSSCGITCLQLPKDINGSCESALTPSRSFVPDLTSLSVGGTSLSDKTKPKTSPELSIAASLASMETPMNSIENGDAVNSTILSAFPPTPSPSLSYAADNTIESSGENCSIEATLSPSSFISGPSGSVSYTQQEASYNIIEHRSQSASNVDSFEQSNKVTGHIPALPASVAVDRVALVKESEGGRPQPVLQDSHPKLNVMVSLPRAFSCAESPRYQLRSPRSRSKETATLTGLDLETADPDTGEGVASNAPENTRHDGFGCELLVCIDKKVTDAFINGSHLSSFSVNRSEQIYEHLDNDDDNEADDAECCSLKDAGDDSLGTVCSYRDKNQNEKENDDKIALGCDPGGGLPGSYIGISSNLPVSDTASLCNASFSDSPSSPVALDICVIDSDRDVIIIDEDEAEGNRLGQRSGIERNEHTCKPGQRGQKRRKRHKHMVSSHRIPPQEARLNLESECVVMLDRVSVSEAMLTCGACGPPASSDGCLRASRSTGDLVQMSSCEVSSWHGSTGSSVHGGSIDLNEAFNSTDLEQDISSSNQPCDEPGCSNLIPDSVTERGFATSLGMDVTNESLISDGLNSDYDPLPCMKKRRRRVEDDMGYSQRKKRRRRLNSSLMDLTVSTNETDR